jgi:colanic acid biosynthesis protein WcaH
MNLSDSKQHPSPSPTPLSPDDYHTATRLTQIVSVDLVVRGNQQILVGRRSNKPAQGTWFVPGGRVYKGERIREAIARISKDELGFVMDPSNLEFLGVYEHVYPDNFRDDTHGTHYVVMAFTGVVDQKNVDPEVFASQHKEMRWMGRDDLLRDPLVHDYTKNYFRQGEKTGLRRAW